MLVNNGYIIRALNTIHFSQSMHYHPFDYIKTETDVLKLVSVLVENTKSKDTRGGEDFRARAEALYYQALIGYIALEGPEEERNFSTLLDFFNASEVRKDNEDYLSPVDMLFMELDKLGDRRTALFCIYRLYRAAVLHSFQNRQSRQICVRCALNVTL